MILINKILFLLMFSLTLFSCTKFVQVGTPQSDLVRKVVFDNDASAVAAIASVYSKMVSTGSYSSGTNTGFPYVGSLSADELDLYSSIVVQKEFSDNNILSSNTTLESSLWNSAYNCIYQANIILEGLQNSSGITLQLKSQLEGEAKFIRSFTYFYLVNMFGDVPLVLTTDYRVNAVISRTSKDIVYKQIITDLKQARDLLPGNYLGSNNERVKPNKFAAIALLARVYLYLNNWEQAETQATEIVNQTTFFKLSPLEDVFLKNSTEAIWQLIRDNNNTYEAATYIVSGTRPVNAALKKDFVQSFDHLDQRKTKWIGTKISGANTYYFPYKYKATGNISITEYSMVLRLAEQFLIRAEARAKLGKVTGLNSAEEDINAIRIRAGMTGTTATTQPVMLDAIEQERKFELFTEWGHRWLDLKRTGKADIILQTIKPDWESYKQLYPIPKTQLDRDLAMAKEQNEGY